MKIFIKILLMILLMFSFYFINERKKVGSIDSETIDLSQFKDIEIRGVLHQIERVNREYFYLYFKDHSEVTWKVKVYYNYFYFDDDGNIQFSSNYDLYGELKLLYGKKISKERNEVFLRCNGTKIILIDKNSDEYNEMIEKHQKSKYRYEYSS